MLDLNAHCPRCGTRLTGPDERCVICHESFDKSRSQRFRRRVAIAIGVPLVSALVAVLSWPALLSGWPWRAAGAPAQAAPTAWSYGAPEPAARVWASPLELNLAAVCRETHTRMSGPKHMGAFIAHRLFATDQVAANLAARTPRWRQLTSEEEQDALGSIGGEAQ